jgi:DNA-binding SARP family transcriptional activator
MIRITALGNYGIYDSEMKNDILSSYCKSEKGCELFRYLLVNYGKKINKDLLLELFWPGMSNKSARQNLSSTLYFIRHAFDRILGNGFGKRICRTTNQSAWLEFDEKIWYDVEEFRKEIKLANKNNNNDEKVEHLMKAATLYNGDYMTEDTFNDWVIPVREELRDIAISALVELTELLLERNRINESMFYNVRLMQIDPYNENAIKNKIRILESQGRLTEARNIYVKYAGHLKRKFNATPGSEISEIANELEHKYAHCTEYGSELSNNLDIPANGKKMGAMLMDFDTFMELSRFESMQREPRGAILSFKINGFDEMELENKKSIIMKLGSSLRRGDVITYNGNNIYILLIKSGQAFSRAVQQRIIEKEGFIDMVKKLGMNLVSEIYKLKNLNDYLLFESAFKT